MDLATGRFIPRRQHVVITAVQKHYRIRSSVSDENNKYISLDSSNLLTIVVANYLLWTFQTSSVKLFASVYALYVLLILFFAVIIHISTFFGPSCLEDKGYLFMDAVHLSWTTLSTVGYGAMTPQLSSKPSCMLVNALMAMEAFVGVLFGSVTGAIVFGKIVQSQTVGEVNFSSMACVVYGDAVHALNNKRNECTDKSDQQHEIPCPVLLFRMSNKLDNVRGGALVDAHVQVVGTTLVEDTHRIHHDNNDCCIQLPLTRPAVRNDTLRKPKGNIIQKMHESIVKPSMDAFERANDQACTTNYIWHDVDEEIARLMAWKEGRQTKTQTLVEEGDPAVVPARLYHSLDLETSMHPFFQRTWIVRHDLNESSPLLREAARRRIRENHGFWPSDWNNQQSVREQIRLDVMIVSLSGTNCGSGSAVNAHKLYKGDFLKVGYDFVTMLHINKITGELHVDHSQLNNIREQQGRASAPLLEVDEPSCKFSVLASDEDYASKAV